MLQWLLLRFSFAATADLLRPYCANEWPIGLTKIHMGDVVDIRGGQDLHDVRARLKSGDGGGTFDDMEPRIKALEDDMKEIKKDLKALLIDTAEIKGTLKSMPSPSLLGELKGRVDSLPTLGKLASLLAIAVAAITIINNWAAIKAVIF